MKVIVQKKETFLYLCKNMSAQRQFVIMGEEQNSLFSL